MDTFPFPACDLLSPAHDTWPIISSYFMDSLDHFATHEVSKYSPEFHAIFMKYWDLHKSALIMIFDEHYPRDDLPKWVDYAGFKGDMVMRLFDHLIICLTDNVDYMIEDDRMKDATTIDLSDVIGYALISDGVMRDLAIRSSEYIDAKISVKTADIIAVMASSETKR